MTRFECGDNQLTSLDFTGLSNIWLLSCSHNQILSLDLSALTNLGDLFCQNNQLTTLDVSNSPHLGYCQCAYNNLSTLYVKNGSPEEFNSWGLDFTNNPNLQYICADDIQLPQVQNEINQCGYTNCFTNSYCSFVPVGTVYTIQGNVRYDESNSGCGGATIDYPNLKLVFTDGVNSGSAFGDLTGGYHYDMQAGTQTVTPVLDNPTYFNVTPNSATVVFPTQTSPYALDFCVLPNGVHSYLEVTILPGNFNAYAGYNSYTISYKNKGTHPQSGNIDFTFDDTILNLMLANPTVSSQVTNILSWNFVDLKPFETREILLEFDLNSYTDTPPVNDGDVLNFMVSLSTSATDETLFDNVSTISQIVSYATLGAHDFVFSNKFTVYPNPVKNILYLETKKEIEVTSISIYNTLGQLVLVIPNAQDVSSIDVSSLKTGNYFIKINSDKKSFNSKFIKE